MRTTHKNRLKYIRALVTDAAFVVFTGLCCFAKRKMDTNQN